MPWKNGLGVTTEIARWPEGDGEFEWRVSAAPVTAAGPFSAYPGLDRILVVVEGKGLTLVHGETGPAVDVRPLRPYAFSGDAPTSCTLPAGPIRDFGVMVRRDRRSARVVVLRRPRTVSLAPVSLVYGVRGEATLGLGRRRVANRPDEAVLVEADPETAPVLQVAPRLRGTVLLLVLLRPR
jgi:environmental stress-induced protein Ves